MAHDGSIRTNPEPVPNAVMLHLSKLHQKHLPRELIAYQKSEH